MTWMPDYELTVDCLFPNSAGGIGQATVTKDEFTEPAVLDGGLTHGCSTLKPLVRGTVLRVFVQQSSGDSADYQVRFQCLRIAPYAGGVVGAAPLIPSTFVMATTNTFDEGTLEFSWGTSDGLVLAHDWTMTFLKVETLPGQGSSVPAVTCELRQNGSPIASVISSALSDTFNIVPVGVDVSAGDVLTLGMLDVASAFPHLRVLAFGATEDTVDVSVDDLTVPWVPYT